MSELVNGGDAPNVIAGEYVLGTLDGDERMHVQSLLASDAEFAAKVKVWERRLGELHLMVEPVEPDRAIWERIKTKLPEVQQQTRPAEPQQVEPEPAEPQQAEPEPAAAQPMEPAPAEHVSAEHAPAAPADDASARLDAAIAAISEAASTAPAEPTSSEAAAADASVAPSPPVAEPPTPPVMPTPTVGREEHRVRRRLVAWRAFAVLMILLVLAMTALVAGWRFAPDRVPPALQPVALLRLVGVDVAPPSPPGPVRRPLPPGSQFDE